MGKTFLKIMKRFAANESGAAIVEYGLALLVVAGVAAAGFQVLASRTADNVDAACVAMSATNAACL